MAQANPFGIVAHGALDDVEPTPPPVPSLYLDVSLPIFYAVEVQTYTPASGTLAFALGYGTRPYGTYAIYPVIAPNAGYLYASDTGYRTSPSDAQGVVQYPGLFDPSSFAVDRGINLDPSSSVPAVSRGTVNFLNMDGDWDYVASTTNSDRRSIRILAGNKVFDQARQLWLDPSYSALIPAFGGIAGPWYCDENALQIPVRDAQYWLTKPIQDQLYGGTGNLDGGADLAGSPLPMVRGGTASLPVNNVPAVLVDAVNLVYQYTDGAGTIINLREGGLAGSITFAGDVTNLYAGSTAAGTYRTNNARGLFQLGSTAQNTITVDCTGAYPVSGMVTTAMQMAVRLMVEDAGMPGQYVDTGSFSAADSLYPYTSGYFVPTSPTACSQVLAVLMQSCGAKLIPSRDGILRCLPLRVIAAGVTPEFSYTAGEIVTCLAQPLGAALSPPPYRYRVAYQENYTIQTQGFNPTISAVHQSFIAVQYRYGTWINAATLLAYNDPNDPDPIPTYLLDPTAAGTLASDMGALWGPGRYLYAVTLPIAYGFRHEIGDVIGITFPTDILQNGVVGTFVREQIRPDQGTTTLYILV